MGGADSTGPVHRPVRSFVLRQGRLSPAQARALEELAPRWCLPFAREPIDFARTFGRRAPIVLEIGCGMGETTAAIAAAQPGLDFVGVEVHGPGVGAILNRIEQGALANLRVIQHDAVEVVDAMIPQASLSGIHVYFPDPWPKKRHHKRRLIQPPFVALLASRLAPGATLHLATDWAPYAEQMLQVLGAEPSLVNTASGFAARPAYRPLTKFELRGQQLGQPSHDLVFRKIG